MDAALQIDGIQFRKRANKKAALGLCGALAIGAFFVIVTNEYDLPKSPMWSIFSAVPFVYGVIGMIESVTRRPYRELSESWKTLKRSQRWILGFFLLESGFLVFLFVAASLFHIWLIVHGDG